MDGGGSQVGPFTGLSLVRPPIQGPGRTTPNLPLLAPGLASSDQDTLRSEAPPEATTGPVGKEGTRNFLLSGSEVG